MIERLEWYNRFQNEVLDYRHRFLIDFDDHEIPLMSRDARRARLTLLDNAKRAYTLECRQRVRGQTVIPNFMAKRIPAHPE